MKKILIRSGKSPHRVAGAAEVLHQDLIGTNTGNLLFSDAVHKLLETPGTTVTSNGIRTDCSAERAAQVNEQFDVFVVPLANAFRPTFHASLDRLTTLVEQLTIPVVVVGVGAQVGEDYETAALSPMADSVKRFVAAVLDRSASIGVRGELTAQYLADLGFRDVEIIGCPSMFLYGDRFPATRAVELGPRSRIALNLSPDALPVGDVAGIARHTWERYPNLTYYAQNTVDGELLLWGDTSPESGLADPFPQHLSHHLLRERKMRLPLDPATWIRELADHDFAFGTRIHGNVAALLAGTPAVVLTHDSRTLELCRYFELPHRPLAQTPPDTDPVELYEGADFSAVAKNHEERFARLVTFLDHNGLANTYTDGDGGAAFEERMAALELPPSLSDWDGSDDGNLRYRISSLRERVGAAEERIERTDTRLRTRLTAAEKRASAAAAQLDSLRHDLELTRSRLKTLDRRVTGVEKRLLVRLGPALRRRVRRLRSRFSRVKAA